MPEGPEVKIMMGNITALALDRQLISVKVIKESFQKKTKDLEKLQAPGVLPKKVIDVKAKGKFGYMLLEDGSSIGLTFGMTGNIRLQPTPTILTNLGETEENYMKHCSIEFQVRDPVTSDETTFYFHCMRNFAWIYYFTESELERKLATIGPSILSDKPLDQETLITRVRKYNHKTICEVLMEQKIISGIGNYIKAEILYTCGIFPEARVKDLDDGHLWSLYTEARKLASNAFIAGGTSLYTYTGITGDQSDFKTQLQVYGRSRDPHGAEVKTMKTPDGRTTYWVESVQTIGRQNQLMPRTKIKARPIIRESNPI